MSTDDSEMYRDWILNVIDQLRKRKARPDIERISHFIERKYGRKRSQTEMHIEKLVDMGIVIKVVYKRGTSYRNASKSRKHRYISNVLNSNIASRKITEAVSSILRERRTSGGSSALTSVTEDHEDEILVVDEDGAGVSGREIESWLSSRLDDEDVEPFLCPIRVVIQREVDAGRILRLENGNFALRHTSDHATKTTNSIPATTTNTKEKSIEPPPRPQLHKSMSVVAKRGRPPKRKLNPVVRSLSCNDAQPLPTRPESEVAPVPVMPPHLCDFCQQSAECNKKDQEEELLFCKDCNAKAHPSCMQYSPELANRARNTAWQCIDCKTCCICSDPGEADCMLFCDACDKGYHMMCHVPEVDDKPQGKWICNECELAGVDVDDIEENNNVVDSTVRSTDSESTSGQRISDSRDGYSLPKYRRESMSPPFVKIPKKEFDEDYPNASEWTTQDVVNFFQKKGFEEEQANTFKEQEIDGQSLLLLKRSDVLQGLSLKLGPALKIYNHVMKLQTFEQPMS